MTGFFEADLFQPLSSVTVAALDDLGYDVDYCGADIWPATEETIKRYEIYKASQEMSMDNNVMERLEPQWEVDVDSAELIPWRTRPEEPEPTKESPPSGSRITISVGMGLLVVLLASMVA